MIFGTYVNTSTQKGNTYWLEASCILTDQNCSMFGVRTVHASSVVGYNPLWYSSGNSYNYSRGVRAVVSL